MRRSVSALVLFLVCVLVPLDLAASTITIDFEGLSDGDAVTNQFSGATFSNAMVLSAGISLNEFEFPPSSGNNVVFDNGGAMSIFFTTPVSYVAGHFTYAVPLFLEAFDVNNVSLGMVSSLFASNLAISGDTGSSANDLLQLSLLGISYITITGDPSGGSFVIDDLTYGTPSVAPVPEPGTLSLLLLGASGVVWRVRRLRRSVPVDSESRRA